MFIYICNISNMYLCTVYVSSKHSCLASMDILYVHMDVCTVPCTVSLVHTYVCSICRIRTELYLEEQEELARRKEREALEAQLRQRIELQRAHQDHLELKAVKEQARKEEEEAFRQQVRLQLSMIIHMCICACASVQDQGSLTFGLILPDN